MAINQSDRLGELGQLYDDLKRIALGIYTTIQLSEPESGAGAAKLMAMMIGAGGVVAAAWLWQLLVL